MNFLIKIVALFVRIINVFAVVLRWNILKINFQLSSKL